MELSEILKQIVSSEPLKAVFSKPSKDAEYKKICYSRGGDSYSVEKFTQKQAFRSSVSNEELYNEFIDEAAHYGQINIWTDGAEHIILISKKGHVSYRKKSEVPNIKIANTHNKKKKYIIEEGTSVPPLVDMGIFTKEGKVVRTMYDKFRQINRFIELINDELKGRERKSINIIDFGCGKSYLTFVVYYYLTEIMGIRAYHRARS